MLEDKVETHLTKGVEAMGGLCLKLNPLWYFGIPDRLLLLPGAIIVFVETKTLLGHVMPQQGRFHKRLRALGFRIEVIWTREQVDEFLASL